MIDKVIRNGKVAVLYSPDFGAGWSTWAHNPENKEQMIFCPALVLALEKGENLKDVAEQLFPNEYFGGLDDLKICWLDEGDRFWISEYDGSERVELIDQMFYHIA